MRPKVSLCGVALALLMAILVAGCGDEPQANPPEFEDIPAEVKACAGADTVKGIDVSKWQGGSIDWTSVAAAGYKFAFVRVSDGINTIDQDFDINWKGTKQNGIIRGAYQFFRPAQDATQEAQVLLNHMGTLEPGDLPPVIDVEDAGGLTKAEVAAKVKEWIDVVEAAVGAKPIIYTGKYFWQDNVGSSAYLTYPLWLAYYTTSCPDTPTPWPMWTFWQFSDSGTVPGISGGVDMDLFEGTIDELKAMTVGGSAPACGDGVCNGDETHATCAQDCVALSFVTPTDGQTVANPVTFRVSADASVASVDYSADGWQFGTSSSSANGFQVTYTFSTLGVRKIKAVGYDGAKKAIAAAAMTITVTAPVDAGTPDSGVHDAGVQDAGVRDSGIHDAGLHDAGVHDAGRADGGTAHDAGGIDTGHPDGGTVTDSGTSADAGHDASFVDATADAARVCNEGALRCGAGGVEACVNGAWVSTAGCGAGTTCENGACVPVAADAGMKTDVSAEAPSGGDSGCGCSTISVP